VYTITVGYGAGQYSLTVSSAAPADVTLSAHGVTGYSAAGCATSNGTDTVGASLTVSTGTTGPTVTNGNTPLDCLVSIRKIQGGTATINTGGGATSRAHNATWDDGGFHWKLTISAQTCATMQC